MKYVNDELWKHPGLPGMIVVTTNSMANSKGELVMGRGSAGEAAKRIPGIQRECADAIRSVGVPLDGTADYGFLVIRHPTDKKVGFGILQAKRDWRNVSDIETISLSIIMLNTYLKNNPSVQVRTVFPGIGCGRFGEGVAIDPKVVKRMLDALPDNLTVCIRPGDIKI